MRNTELQEKFKIIGNRVGEIRETKGLTQQKLADLLDMPLLKIQRLEAGQHVTLKTLFQLEKALSVHFTDFFKQPKRLKPSSSGRPRKKPKKGGV
jgi:transcriptional regulator with XRE-family HTH domain